MTADPQVVDFSQHPQSISELRSNKTHAAADWTPRDALISILRAMDAGDIAPEHLIIVYREALTPDYATCTRFQVAGKDPHVTLGLLTRVIQEIVGRPL